MSMWQYFAALDGFVKGNNPDDGKSLSDKEKEALWEWIEGG